MLESSTSSSLQPLTKGNQISCTNSKQNLVVCSLDISESSDYEFSGIIKRAVNLTEISVLEPPRTGITSVLCMPTCPVPSQRTSDKSSLHLLYKAYSYTSATFQYQPNQVYDIMCYFTKMSIQIVGSVSAIPRQCLTCPTVEKLFSP